MPRKPETPRKGPKEKKPQREAQTAKEPDLNLEDFAALVRSLPDLIFFLSRDGIFFDYHTPDPSQLLFPPEKFLGRHFKEVLPGKIVAKLALIIKEVQTLGKVGTFEYDLKISGQLRHFEARVSLYGHDKFLVIVRDITEQKRLADALRESHEKYRQLVECAPAGIYEFDFSRQKFISVNDQLCEYLGYSREEMLSMHPLDILTEESQGLFVERIGKIISHQSVSSSTEYKIRNKQGDELWVLLNNRKVYRKGKLVGATVVVQDITAIKEAEAAAREYERHLRALMENARDFAIYRLVYDDTVSYGLRVIFVSPSLDDILGPADLQRVETWFETVHPDDWARVQKAQLKAFETMKFDEEARIFNPKKGEWRWVRATSTRVADETGQHRYVNGTVIDITERKRGEEVLQQSHDHLEYRVKTRTAQLTMINEKLKKEIRERRRVERALNESQEKLRFLNNRLITAQEDERKRISNELHDELGQSVVGLKYQVSNLPKLLKDHPGQAAREIKQSLELIDGLSENIRRISRDLRPMVLEHLGLWEGLQWLFDEGAQKYGFKIINTMPNHHWPLSKEQELIVFRVFQEAMTNIEKHARASQVFIKAHQENDTLILSIRDDGRGFNPKAVTARRLSKRGLGLTTMTERAHMAGGTLAVTSAKGKGTTITFSIPLAKRRRKTAGPKNEGSPKK